MTVLVKNNRVQIAPRKVRLVCDLIRRKKVSEALDLLRYNEKKEISLVLYKLINSGVAIAAESKKYDLDNLVVDSIKVDQGQTLKRIMPRAQGRAYRISKRTSHITVELAEQ